MSPTAHPWIAYPRSITSRLVWSTEDELLFVTFLGTWREQKEDRAQLLRRYLAVLPHRRDWGQIDVVQVRLQVERLLAEDEAEAG
jgi:hypothetical protein